MLKIINLIAVFAVVLIFLCYLKPFQKKSTPILLKFNQIVPAPSIENDITLLSHMNARNALIENILYPHVVIKTENIRLGAELNANLMFEKPLKFRMMVYSFFGKESDIGSNDEVFWFWSKRMDPPALFYAKHEDLYKTRLKTPFHPAWIREIIGVSAIDLDNLTIFKQDDFLVLMKHKMGILGEPILRVYLIDPLKMTFKGHYIYKTDGSLVASAEVLEYYEVNGYFLPKVISTNWAEEGLKSKWIMDCPVINTKIDPSNWKCDNYKNRIDLNGYAPRFSLSF
jgi:hypothetical protein